MVEIVELPLILHNVKKSISLDFLEFVLNENSNHVYWNFGNFCGYLIHFCFIFQFFNTFGHSFG